MLNPSAPSLVVETILLLVVFEAAALVLLWRWRRIGIPPQRLLPMLAAGACLLLALRAALVGQPWHMSALWLGLSLLAHLADVAGRWQRRHGDAAKAPSR